MQVIHPKLQLQCHNKAFIQNMDQTPIPFTFNSKTTLEVVVQEQSMYASLQMIQNVPQMPSL